MAGCPYVPKEQMFQSCKHVFRPLATAKRLLEGLQWNVSIVQARLSPFSPDHVRREATQQWLFQSCKHVFRPLATTMPRAAQPLSVFQSCKHVFRPLAKIGRAHV